MDRQAAGSAQLFRLNRDHLAAGPIQALASLRDQLVGRVRDDLAGWPRGPLYAALFGSTARSEERADSDIDVFLLRPDGVGGDDEVWRTHVSRLERDISRWTGNDTRVLELGAADLAGHRPSATPVGTPEGVDDSVLDDVLRDGIPLAGDPAPLRAARRSLRSPG